MGQGARRCAARRRLRSSIRASLAFAPRRGSINASTMLSCLPIARSTIASPQNHALPLPATPFAEESTREREARSEGEGRLGTKWIMDFSDQQIRRYARHILLNEIGGAGQ